MRLILQFLLLYALQQSTSRRGRHDADLVTSAGSCQGGVLSALGHSLLTQWS